MLQWCLLAARRWSPVTKQGANSELIAIQLALTSPVTKQGANSERIAIQLALEHGQ